MSKKRRSSAALRRAAEAVESSRSAVLITHVRPDGDAVGCLIALTAIMRAMGKRARPRCIHAAPRRYAGLAGASWISVGAPRKRLRAADTVVALDSATFERTGFAGHLPDGARLVNIDHHVSNGGYGDVAWIDDAASSTGEMLLRLALERAWPLPPAARDALYAAIYTDTGRFSYSNTSPRALELAAELVRRGVRPDRLYRMIYCARRRAELELEALARSSMKVTASGRVASIAISRADFRKTGTGPLDLEEFAQIPMQIEGVEVGILLYALGGRQTKVSLRSAEYVDVSRLAAGFGGGGHARAAGCELPLGLAAARKKIVAAVRRALR